MGQWGNGGTDVMGYSRPGSDWGQVGYSPAEACHTLLMKQATFTTRRGSPDGKKLAIFTDCQGGISAPPVLLLAHKTSSEKVGVGALNKT